MIEDSKIREALHHWTPRFLAIGVDYNDLQRIIGNMQSWDDWCRVWSEMGAEHEALAEQALTNGHTYTAGEVFSRAAIYYHFGQMIFYTDKVQKLAAHRRQVELYVKAAPLLTPPAERLEIPFEETSLPAYLRLPAGSGPHPCVILVCGLDSVKEQESHWEEELLARGMATLSFDGPGQGEMWHRMKMRTDFEVAVVALVDYMLTRDDIDAGHIGLLGHSMGGHFGARAAAREQRLAAAVLLAGFFELRPWEEMSVFMRAGLQHIFGAVSEAEARDLARRLTLEGVAADIRCPLLIIHGAKDTLLSLEEAQRLEAATTCPSELLVFPEGNHSCNNIVYKVHPAAADWLADRLVCK
ncbi:MAG: alpha/beta hydrolase family protein [Anaerolineae bacterium]